MAAIFTYLVSFLACVLLVAADPCFFNPCLNGGSCDTTPDHYTCACTANYTGVVCDERIGPCSFPVCFNGGTCSSPDGQSYSCACPAGFGGVVCQTQVTAAPVTAAPTDAPTAAPTAAPTVATTPAPSVLDVLGNAGCDMVDMVFMVEHVVGDSRGDVDHEADFIRNLVNGWPITSKGVRVGVLVYDEEIKEHIHLDDYEGDKDAVIDKLNELSRQIGNADNSNVGSVLDYACRHMFKDPRGGAEQAAVVFVHQMTPAAQRDFAAAAANLKSEGVTLYALGVDVNDADRQLLQGNADHYFEFDSWNELENSIPYAGFRPNCS